MNQTRDTLKHAAIYSGAALIGRMIGFIMLPFYAHRLGSEGYAVIGLLDMGLALLASLLAFGVRDAIVRLYHDQGEESKKKSVVSTGMILIGVATVLVILPFLIFSKFASSLLFGNPDHAHLVVLALLAFTLDFLGQGASSWLLIQRRSVQFSAINLTRLFVGLSLNIWLIVIKDLGLDGYFISSMMTNVVVTGILVFIVWRACPLAIDRDIARKIVSFMLPLVPGALVSFIARQAERVLLRVLVSLESVGILEMAYRFPVLLVQLVVTPFMQSWNTTRFEICEQGDAPQQIGKMFTYFMFLVVFFGVLIAATISPILQLLTPEEFWPAGRIAKLEIITQIFQGAFYHLSFGILYAKRTDLIAKIRGWASLGKLILAYLFIYFWGINGAAFSAAITATFILVVTHLYSQKFFRIHLEWTKLIIMGSVALVVYFVATSVDLDKLALYKYFNEEFVPAVASLVGASFVGNWKDGKAVFIIAENSGLVSEIITRGLFSMFFIILLPWVNPGVLSQIKNRINRTNTKK